MTPDKFGEPRLGTGEGSGGASFGPEAIEAAAQAYYDGMIGREDDQWPHHLGWAGKSEAFKAKVRAHMARALEATRLVPAPHSQAPNTLSEVEETRALVAALGEPHCWVVPGQDTANCYGYIDAHCCQEGEMSRPLWSLESIKAALATLRASQEQDGEVRI